MSGAKMQLEDWLDDLCVRFIINLPQEDLSSVPRICFQVEEAQWFYEDFIRPLDPTLPSMTLRTFCLRIFQHCPLLTTFPVGVHIQAFEEFLQYKTRVPVRGAILLNEAMDSVLLVRGWKKGANWSFPRGKINKDEDDLDCAIREVDEETGFDVRAAGLVPTGEATKFIEVTMRDQQIRLYVFRNVPMDTHFHPRTRKEISKIQWYKLSELPAFRKKGHQNQHDNQASNATNANKFYMVAPFLVPLKKWIVQQLKKDSTRRREEVNREEVNTALPETVPEETATEDETWNQSQPQRAPDPDALEGATRELHRLLKIQPPTQGIQLPSQASSEQDKGPALLALLQSRTPVANQYRQAPFEVANTEVAQPKASHSHPSSHPPPASQDHTPAYPVATSVEVHAPAARAGSQHAHYSQAGVPHYQHQNRNVHSQNQPHVPAPALVHPQPLPPQVQKTGVFNYTTPPPHTLPKALGVPPGSHLQGYHHGYASRQPGQQHGAPLNQHSKALLNAFKSRPAPNNVQEPVELPAHQPQQSHKQSAPAAPSYRNQVPDIAAAARPYHQAQPSPSFPTAMQPPQPRIPSAGASKGQGQSEKHRSALLGMFKQSTSPREGTFATAAGGSVTNSKQSSLAGASPQVPLANLSAQAQSGSPSRAYHSPGLYNDETGPPKAPPGPGTGSSQPLMQLLRRQEEAPASSQRPGPSPAYAAYDPAQAAPSTFGSPPAPTSFPAPVFHRQQEAAPEHKQKLLSLFSRQELSAGTEEMGEANKGKGTASAMEYQGGSVPTGAGTGNAKEGARQGRQTPISSADRSFLLGYLQSATHGR